MFLPYYMSGIWIRNSHRLCQVIIFGLTRMEPLRTAHAWTTQPVSTIWWTALLLMIWSIGLSITRSVPFTISSEYDYQQQCSTFSTNDVWLHYFLFAWEKQCKSRLVDFEKKSRNVTAELSLVTKQLWRVWTFRLMASDLTSWDTLWNIPW